MEAYPTWNIIVASFVLILLGYYIGGFFIINYYIGAAGLCLGLYNLWKKKK
tara:strand:+ start:441 stop:593 length:153 start_codon:yes stop_codon:yes gene_type:complete